MKISCNWLCQQILYRRGGSRPSRLNPEKEDTLMQWEAPDFVEISVGCEINSYATAEI